MVQVAQIYRGVLDGELTTATAESRFADLQLPGAACNAYITGEPGWRRIIL
jgi:hypothetical protein